MENKPVKDGSRKPKIKKPNSDVKQVTIDESVINNYVFKIVALESAEKANGQIIDQLNNKILDLKQTNVKLSNENIHLKYSLQNFNDQIKRIPTWIRNLFGVK